ncbi:dihydrofolate reductase family protein [Nocardioides sp. MAHUQ-72]|uniref:dihydrofolate reductase family protein n=1 Tax=unclassified Nocardioides TaxID=2615069 RepID=UPI00361ACA74
MRLLTGAGTTGAELSDDDLAEVYAVPSTPWLRVNMVSTVDGSATGGSGLTGSINNPADKRVFDLLRRLADVVVVGAGTARAEGYGPTDLPLVLVSRRAEVPEKLRGAEPGRVLMATCGHAERLEEARELLGEEHVLVCGSHRVDLADLRDRLVARGWTSILSEGGPHLLHDLVAQGVADELACTWVPRLVAGSHPRITDGPELDVPLTLQSLVEEDGTLLGRWLL